MQRTHRSLPCRMQVCKYACKEQINCSRAECNLERKNYAYFQRQRSNTRVSRFPKDVDRTMRNRTDCNILLGLKDSIYANTPSVCALNRNYKESKRERCNRHGRHIHTQSESVFKHTQPHKNHTDNYTNTGRYTHMQKKRGAYSRMNYSDMRHKQTHTTTSL